MRPLLVAVVVGAALAGHADAAPSDGSAGTGTFKVDAARTSFLPEGPQPPLRLRWSFRSRESEERIESFALTSDGFSPATVHAGVVYAGANDGWVYAMRSGNGKLLWEYFTGGAVEGAPQFAGGRVVVGSMDGHLRSLEARFGTLVWKTKFGVRIWNEIAYGGMRSSPLIDGGRIFMGACDGVYRAIDLDSGRILWETDGGGVGAMSSPALWNGTLFVGHDGVKNTHLFALDPASGAVRWRFPVPSQIFSTPAVADGVVYVHVRNDHVYALRAADGSLVWKTPAALPEEPWRQVWMNPSKSSPAVARGRVFVGIGKDLVALDRATGRVLWKAATGGKVDSSPLVVGETVYVGSDDRVFSALAAGDGRKVWSFETGGRISSSPTSADGLVVIGASDGVLYAFEEAPRPRGKQGAAR